MQGGRRLTQEKKGSVLKGRTVPIVCAVVLTAGGLLAAHIISDQKRAAQELSRFHISSNYLEESGGARYTVSDWGDGFEVLLFNHEKEDINQIAAVDMTYTATAEHASVSVRKQNGDEVPAAEDGVYSFGTELTAAYHVLHVTPEAGEGDAVSVTVQTASPYQKTLSAEFQVQHLSKPDYTVTDQNDGTILITVDTNDYQDVMTVVWEPEKYSPDHANELMSSWTDEAHIGHFPVSRDSAYELLFFKKTDDPYPGQKGAATMISLD